MRDLDKALADILAIRNQIAAGTAFLGYGPLALVATGVLALATAAGQSLWLGDPTAQATAFLLSWAIAAVVAVAIIAIEMRGRSRRHHSGLADAMIHQAVEQFAPAAAAGILLTVLFVHVAPEAVWMLPGLWQILVGLGIFASMRSLPRAVGFVGAWYFAAGFGVLLLASESHALSPWTMGVPFAIGQFMMAAVIHLASGARDAEI